MALTGITLFRAQEGVESLDDLIPSRLEPGRLAFEDFRLADGSIALVYYATTPNRPPQWASFFRGIVDADELSSQSSSAVIAFQRHDHWYLATFGYGRYLINLDLMESSFGLRCTLNGIDPQRIRAIDRKRVDAVSRLTREQLSRDSRMGTFGLDVHQDLLSAVNGTPTDTELGTRIYGKDAVGLRLDIRPRDLGTIADRLEELFQDDAYREHFRWVDNIAEVTQTDERHALTQALIAALRTGNADQFHLAPPELVDWSQAHGFLYPRVPEVQPELTLAEYFALVRGPDEIDDVFLKADRVQLVDAGGDRLGGWSVYRCLNGEMQYEGSTYVISDGKWYRVDRDFMEEINAAVGALITDSVHLPEYSAEDGEEADYNQRVADESNGELALMDQRWIWPRSWQDRIELCDLYRADGTLIHVKRFSGGSAALSHLFAQGGVSLRCLLTDRPFLESVNDLLPESHRLPGVPAPDACHVVYAVVSEPGRDMRLPFFSRVSLRNSADMITNLGARVSLQAIANAAAE